ncbi:MAG: MFS transporter [Verrucomicrobiales bacterium]
MESPSEAVTQATFRNELLRSIPAGVLETVTATFAILIAEKVFQASPQAKELALMGGRGGLAASFAVVWVLSKFRRPLNQLVAWLNHAAGACFVLSALLPEHLWAFVAGCSLGMFWFGFQTPLLTTIYRENYPEARRGRLYSLSALSRSAATILFAWAAGKWLDADLDNYRWLLWIFAGCSFVSGWLLWQIPCRHVGMGTEKAGLFRAFRWLRLDPVFRLFLIAYMVLGLGNLVMDALRTEFLVNPAYGVKFKPSEVAFQVAMLTSVVPMVFKLVSAWPWGVLFDKVSFITVRTLLNILFALSIVVYFIGPSYAWWWAGAALLGLAYGGGNVVWNLWVTKLAPGDRVADYMSVHTFLTGLRGLIAPVIAFRLVGLLDIASLAWICAAMIVFSTFLILPEWRNARAKEEPPPLEET